MTIGPAWTNIDFSGTDLKVIQPMPPAKGYRAPSCEGKFVPMQ